MFDDSDWVCTFLFVLTNNISVVRNNRLQKSEYKKKCTRWGSLMICIHCVSWNTWILFHWNWDWCSPGSLASFWLWFAVFLLKACRLDKKILFEDEDRVEELMKEEDFLDALDHILAGTDGSKVVNELISQLLLVRHGNGFEVVF